MRLKTLRKERPAFESEGAVISGSRLDLANTEYKPPRYRTNNAFVLPTSLNHELSTLHMSSADSHDEHTTTTHHLQSASTQQILAASNTSQTTSSALPSYQALEAAYLERGIRIQMDPNTAAALNQQQITTTDRSHGNKSTTLLQRPRAFANRNPSRSSSAFQYQVILSDLQQDGRPFSALHTTSNHDFDRKDSADDPSSLQGLDLIPLAMQHHQDFSSNSILASEHSTPITPTEPMRNPAHETKSFDNDPDLIYMSQLLKTTNGDSFRDTIRRRAGLRGTFEVHRHPQPPSKTSMHKTAEAIPVTYSSTAQRKPPQRPSMTSVHPASPSTKRVEKDILKHASRIRTSHSKECYSRQESPLRSRKANQTPSVSTSPTRTYHREIKQTKLKKLPKPISLEPLEILLAPDIRPSTSPARTCSSSAYDLLSKPMNGSATERISKKSTIRPSQSDRLYPDDVLRSLYLHARSDPSSVPSDDPLSLMKVSPLYVIATTKSHPSNSCDSGCYDPSSRSNSTHEAPSANSSNPSPAVWLPYSTRVTSAKKVAFDDQSSEFVLSTATYV